MVSSRTQDDAPASDRPELLRALAHDLAAARYTVDEVAELLGAEARAALSRDQIVPALAATRAAGEDPARNPLGAVVRFFLLARPLPEAALGTVFPALGPQGLRALGLAEPADDGGWLAAVDLRPYGWDAGDGAKEIWVASDLAAHQRPGVLRSDHVLGIGHASATLVQTTARRQVGCALDLGTGCGIQAFHLLGHARHVVATDISERALAFARFNLLLNAGALGLDPDRLEDRIELRRGSLLDPVAGELFDLVVSNPPFVITPRAADERAEDQFTYRDGGLPGDELVARLVAGLPAVLAEGGTAQLLGNWEIPAGAPWHERVRSWVSADVDAWVVQREEVGPGQYAETWLADASQQRDPGAYEDAYAAYLADFAARGTAAIGFGAVWLRRPAPGQARLDRFEELTHPLEQPIGPYWAAAVERADWLAAHPDLGAERLVVAGDVTEERHQRPGAEHPGVILLRQGAGFRRTILLSTELAGFVSACDGGLTAGQIASALAALLGRDDEGFRPGLLAEAANLVAEGFLVPAETAAGPADDMTPGNREETA
ncbi:Methyltransferase family protein [Sinomonas atrocyanea]|uniref:Methyltransferase family protein n=1 Tax=Sinomonas atrocyanea TaxID=37927 RepID=A0A127A3D1_9MICC|nr:Methyltransferase family protein [Sinomonas atrocyanea]GEB63431.1 methyltransferase [Sinomonas atrocyanea]GGG72915.1 methyltransferase [Sinomonas atrocyanea]